MDSIGESVVRLMGRRDAQIAMAVGASGLGLGYMVYKRSQNLPPGPTGWPLIGTIVTYSEGTISLSMHYTVTVTTLYISSF